MLINPRIAEVEKPSAFSIGGEAKYPRFKMFIPSTTRKTGRLLLLLLRRRVKAHSSKQTAGVQASVLHAPLHETLLH
jgi:hypothetical protein